MKSSSRALHMAHYLQAHADEQQPLSGKNKPQTWSDFVGLGWYLEFLRERLKSGVVTFSFWKKDGSIREAKGTLHPLLIPFEDRPTTNDKRPTTNYGTIPFYDIDKKAWRSFSVTHFIGFVSIYKITNERWAVTQ